jgi:hypothetical protein
MHVQTLAFLLLVLSQALLACGDNEVNSSRENQGGEGTSALPADEDGTTAFEGVILEVMESFPLQWTVQANAGRYHVGLLKETIVSRGSIRVDAGELTPGLRVRVEGEYSAPNAVIAQEIEILS